MYPAGVSEEERGHEVQNRRIHDKTNTILFGLGRKVFLELFISLIKKKKKNTVLPEVKDNL